MRGVSEGVPSPFYMPLHCTVFDCDGEAYDGSHRGGRFNISRRPLQHLQATGNVAQGTVRGTYTYDQAALALEGTKAP